MKYSLAILIVMLVGSATSSRAEPVKVATYMDFPPFVTDQEPGGGLITEIITASFDAENIEFNLQLVPWKRSYRAVAHGEIPASYPWAYSEERAKDFIYSVPLFAGSNSILSTIPDLTDISSLVTLVANKGKKLVILCVPHGWQISEEVHQLVNSGTLTLISPGEPRSCIELMRAARTDLIYLPEITAYYHIQMIMAEEGDTPSLPWPPLYSVSVDSYHSVGQHMIFTKNEAGEALKKQFENGFKKIVDNGTYADILQRFISIYEEDARRSIIENQVKAGILPASPR